MFQYQTDLYLKTYAFNLQYLVGFKSIEYYTKLKYLIAYS